MNQSRSKPAVRGVRGPKSKANRRAPVKSGNDIPIMAVVVGVILLLVFIGLLIWGVRNNQSASGPPSVAASGGMIPCDALERTQVHYHASLQIIDATGTVHPLPSGLGVQGSEASPSCFYWLHVHAANKNVIHIESPADRVFTLGDFFKVWNTFSTYNGGPAEKLDSTHVSTLTVAPGQTVVIYIDLNDGKGPQPYTGDPNAIVLKSHETVTIEVTPPTTPPPAFTFAKGL